MIRSELITAAVELPLSLADAKEHLRVTDTYDDAYIMALIEAGTAHAEYITNRKLLTQTWSGDFIAQEVINLPFGKLQSVDQVSYIEDGQEVIIDPSEYTVRTGDRGTLTITDPSVSDVLTVQFTSGYATTSDIPANIKHGIKMLVSTLYENREDTTELRQSKVAIASENLLRPYRLWC